MAESGKSASFVKQSNDEKTETTEDFDPRLAALIKQAGASSIYEFIERHGGIKEVTKEIKKKSTAPPPPPPSSAKQVNHQSTPTAESHQELSFNPFENVPFRPQTAKPTPAPRKTLGGAKPPVDSVEEESDPKNAGSRKTSVEYDRNDSKDCEKVGLSSSDEEKEEVRFSNFGFKLKKNNSVRNVRPTQVPRPPVIKKGFPMNGFPTITKAVSMGELPTSSRKAKKEKKRITKDDISSPIDFVHVQHVGWNPEIGFDTSGLDPHLVKYFNIIAETTTFTKDRETRQFNHDVVEKDDGLERGDSNLETETNTEQTKEPKLVTAPPPPPPHRSPENRPRQQYRRNPPPSLPIHRHR